MSTFLLYFHSGTKLAKVLFVGVMTIVFALFGYAFYLIINASQNWQILIIVILVIIFVIFAFYVFTRITLEKLLNYKKGLKSKNKEEKIFLNIDLKRENFKPEDFKKYQKHYLGFYKRLFKKYGFKN